MKTSSAKAKGRRFAQEIKDLLIKYAVTRIEDEDIVVTSSGDTGEDLKLSPRARSVYPVSIECKNQEKLNIWESLKQAESNAGIYTPVLFFRRNRSKQYAVVEAETLIRLVRYYKKGEEDEFQGES